MPSDSAVSLFNRIYSSEFYSDQFFFFRQFLSNLQKEGFCPQDLLDLSSDIDSGLFSDFLTSGDEND